MADEGAEARRPDGRDKGVRWGRVILTATSVMIALLSFGWWNGIPPLGDDASGHIVLMARVAEALETGSGWWAPDFNLGFPIGLYYQPLPHFFGGVLTFLAGGGSAAIPVYKITTVLLLVLTPWATFLGARRMGLRPMGAAAAGVLAPMVVSSLSFGLTTHSSLSLALHSQAWAGVALPIAVGELARAIEGRGHSRATAVLSWALLFLCHFFYGLALIALAAVWILSSHPRHWFRRALRALVVALCTAASLSFWFIPLAKTLPAMGGWPFGSDMRVHGYGLGAFVGPLVQGQVLDGETGPPILSGLAFLGVLICISSFLRRPAARLLVSALLLWAAFTIGRTGFGALVDIFPPNRAVQMFRYLGLFHLFAVLCAGFAVGEILEVTRENRSFRTFALVAFALLWAGLAGRGGVQLGAGFQTIDKTGLNMYRYHELVSTMKLETAVTGPGRTYAFPRSGLRGHFYSGLLGLWDAGDMGESRGAGLHDSLNYYFLEFLHPESLEENTLLELYGFQYIASSDDVFFDDAGTELVFNSPDYGYWRVDHRVSICAPIRVERRFSAYPREIREDARRWLESEGPAAGIHPLVSVPGHLALGGVTDGPVQVSGTYELEPTGESADLLVMSQNAPDRAVCRVHMALPGAVLFRIGYHPFWQATVDGRPVETQLTYPALVAVDVDEGAHDVAIRYRLPWYVHPLLWFACVPILALWWRDRRLAPPRQLALCARVTASPARGMEAGNQQRTA